jgi:integrase
LVDYTDSRGNRLRRHFPTKKAADAFRINIEGQLATGVYRPDASRVTLVQACESFLAHCSARHERDERMTRKMLVVYRGHINNYILHPSNGLGGWRLSQLTARAVGEFRDRIRSAGLSVPTARKVLATLHSVLEHAIGQDWIAANAARAVKVIGPRGEGSVKITPPTKPDMRRLIEGAGEELRLMVIFAAATGARAGEQWACRWHDIDFEKCELRISRRVDAYGEEGAPKSTAGARTVPLSAPLVAALKAWRLRSRFSRPEDLVFPNGLGRHMGHDNLVKRQFLPLLRKLGIRRMGWHSLRHFAVSCWIEQGLAPKTVQTFAGHASLAITMDRYGHLFPSEDHRKAMDQIAGDLFQQP